MIQSLKFIAYKTKHKVRCLALFKGNIKGYFAAEEIIDYQKFLDVLSPKDHYYIAINQAQLVACGGYDIQETGYFLRWGLVDHTRHKSGIGTQLLKFRIETVRQNHGQVAVMIKTSGKEHGFYQKFGFVIHYLQKDAITAGIDEYQMVFPEDAHVDHYFP